MAKQLEGTHNVLNNLKEYREILFDEAANIFEGVFKAGTEQARARAPWQDRTTYARTSIESVVAIKRNENIIGVLGIGAGYGVHLELANGGKYRIIRPTLVILQEVLKDQFEHIKIKDLA